MFGYKDGLSVVVGRADQRLGHVVQVTQDQADVLVQLQAVLHVLVVAQLRVAEKQKRRVRVAKFKRPRVLGDQKINEVNQEFSPGCPPDYQMFCVFAQLRVAEKGKRREVLNSTLS